MVSAGGQILEAIALGKIQKRVTGQRDRNSGVMVSAIALGKIQT